MIASKEDYHIHMNDEHFEEVKAKSSFLRKKQVTKVLKIIENFPTIKRTKTTKLEATAKSLNTETYNAFDYYKIKFIFVTAITRKPKRLKLSRSL